MLIYFLKNIEGAKNSYFIVINDDSANQLLKNKSYYKLISIYLEKKNFLQAEFYLEKMLFFEQNKSQYFDAAIYKIIDFYYSNQKYARIGNLSERLQEVNINTEPLIYLFYMEGMAKLALGKNEQAIKVFEKAIQEQDANISMYYFEILYQISLLYYDKEQL